MEILEYYAGLRTELLELLKGVHSADPILWWDDESPNWLTKQKLKDIFKKYLALAKPFGLHLITRHNPCGNSKHGSLDQVIESDIFPTSWNDPSYARGDFPFQEDRLCECPCSKNSGPTKHGVMDEFVYPKSDRDCKTISNVLLDVSSAIENAQDRKPRSGIREYVLRAIITLNDAILPFTVDEYLAQQLGKPTGAEHGR